MVGLFDEQTLNFKLMDDVICLVENAIQITPRIRMYSTYMYVLMYVCTFQNNINVHAPIEKQLFSILLWVSVLFIQYRVHRFLKLNCFFWLAN